MADDPALEPEAGPRGMDRYEKQGLLGEGANGVVYDARDRVSGHRVALKKVRMGKAKVRAGRECGGSSPLSPPPAVIVSPCACLPVDLPSVKHLVQLVQNQVIDRLSDELLGWYIHGTSLAHPWHIQTSPAPGIVKLTSYLESTNGG